MTPSCRQVAARRASLQQVHGANDQRPSPVTALIGGAQPYHVAGLITCAAVGQWVPHPCTSGPRAHWVHRQRSFRVRGRFLERSFLALSLTATPGFVH